VSERVDLLLVCTAGGHLQEMWQLKPAWEGFSRAWVGIDLPDTRSLLKDERVYFAHYQGPRNLTALPRNALRAFRLLRRLRPKALLTTGAAVAVPYAWVARLLGIPVVFVELFTRTNDLSLAARLIAPAAETIYVQWPELEAESRKARFAGSIFLADP
jgi:beta-1,4-N-acetylglucosaminyltransferase